MSHVRVEFTNGAIDVYTVNGEHILHQPFAPGPEKKPWADQAEALAWYESVRSIFEYDLDRWMSNAAPTSDSGNIETTSDSI